MRPVNGAAIGRMIARRRRRLRWFAIIGLALLLIYAWVGLESHRSLAQPQSIESR